jgi:hypothetical protein
MPRDGSGIYTKPFPDVVTGTTIQSTVHNGTISDVAQDLNAPRPIVAGGTGANNARDAMTSLQGDVAYQVVTNYDAYPFVSGSFYSAAGATSAPTANAFIGQCYTSDPAVVPPAVPAGQNMFIEARDVTTGLKYVRQKVAGVWINSGAWKQQAGSSTDLDAAYVNVTGDTMTGPLTLPGMTVKAAAGTTSITMNDSVPTSTATISLSNAKFRIEDNALPVELVAASNAGNAGQLLLNSDGSVSMSGAAKALSHTSAATATTGTYYFGNSGTKTLTYDGTVFAVSGGPFNVSNTIASLISATTGAYYFGNSGTKSLSYDGTNFNLAGGLLNVVGVISSADITCYRTAVPTQGYHFFGNSGAKYLGFDGTNFSFTAAGGNLYVNGAQVSVVSDYRIKKDVIDLPGMWDTVKSLRPIKYTQAEFSPPSYLAHIDQMKAEGKAISDAPLYPADDIERWGFIAHELQEALTPSAASGVKDAPDEIQSPNPFSVIAALTKALQEAMTRIEALEAR